MIDQHAKSNKLESDYKNPKWLKKTPSLTGLFYIHPFWLLCVIRTHNHKNLTKKELERKESCIPRKDFSTSTVPPLLRRYFNSINQAFLIVSSFLSRVMYDWSDLIWVKSPRVLGANLLSSKVNFSHGFEKC